MLQKVSCRPLLKPNFQKNNNFMDVPYSFTLTEIQQMYMYLPTSIKFMGIDFEGEIPSNQPKMIKHRAKTIGSAGINVKNKQKLQFQSLKEYVWVSWDINPMIVFPEKNITRNSDSGNQLKLKVMSLLLLINKNNKNIIKQDDNLSSMDLQNCQVSIRNQKNSCYRYDNISLSKKEKKRKMFTGNLKIGLLLRRNQIYSAKNLLEWLSVDISSALNIMDCNEIVYRDIRLILQVIALQNFTKTPEISDKNFEHFILSIKSKTKSCQKEIEVAPNIVHSQDNEQPLDQGTDKTPVQTVNISNTSNKNNKSNSIVILCLILVLTIIGYLYIRLKLTDSPTETM